MSGDERETEAERSLRWLMPNRRRQIEGWKEGSAHVPRLQGQFDDVPASSGSDFLTLGLQELADSLLPVMIRQRPGSEQLVHRLRIAGLQDDEVVAALTAFPDGSARVLISDGMVGMLRLLADLVTVWYFAVGGQGWRNALRMLKALQDLDRDEGMIPILAVALRWNLIHRRSWGTSATLAVEPEGEEANLRDVYAQTALVFVLAHECSHLLLGHDHRDIGSWQVEHAADALALTSTREHMRSLQEDVPLMHTLVGARLAMLATQLVEQTLFVRPPVVHPSAEARWAALADRVGDLEEVRKARGVSAGLEHAASKVSDLRFALPKHWWDVTYSHPRVHCDVHEPAYYEHFNFFDRISFGDPNDPARLLDTFASEHGIDAITPALAARDHGLATGLQRLGVDPESAQAAARTNVPLSFHSLTEITHSSPCIAAAPTATTQRLAATATATLMGGVEKGIL